MPENLEQFQGRLTALRKKMEDLGCDGYILPRTDAYQGEFLAEHDERLAWLTGFTGSAGLAVVLQDKAVVMSDSRYTIQLTQQVPASLYSVDDSIQNPAGKWLAQFGDDEMVIGYDMWLFTPAQIEKIEEDLKGTGITLVALEDILLDQIWSDQPEAPCALVETFPDTIAGQTSEQKRIMLAQEIQTQGCDAALITLPDSICWLLNVRGSDIAYSPLVQCYGLLHSDASFDWFINPDKVPRDVANHLGQGVRIVAITDMPARLSEYGGKVWLDRKAAPCGVEVLLDDLYDEKDPCILPKAMKSPEELEAMKFAHIQDGAALVRFLKWLDEESLDAPQSEISVEDKLEAFRRLSSDYIGPSFPTISGFASNGAIVHYRASAQTDKAIEGDNLLLVDSGGQYHWGTTDVTRTMAIGTPSQKMKEHYTRVLKGHIAVSMAMFDEETLGKDIDELARAPLQEVGLNYGHGTGHGVGCYLCVHEDATSISPRSESTFEAGMVISNEPGYYEEGAHGIRIENLLAVLKDPAHKGGFVFETLTLAPYAPALVEMSLLNDDERQWLDEYQDLIEGKLSAHLSDDEMEWLQKQRII